MLITVEMLRELNACQEGIAWFRAQRKREARAVIRACLADDRFDYANWLLARVLSATAAVDYACHAAELVLPIFEQAHPTDRRPRLAIAAARSGVNTAAAAAWRANPKLAENIIEYGIGLL